MIMFMTNTAYAQSTSCLPGSLKSTLNTINKKFGRVNVVSTHKPGARIAGSRKRSYHASCRAVDFIPARGTYKRVLSYLKKTHKGGLITYSCSMHHIHIDNGPNYRGHKCFGKHGHKHYKKKKRKSRR